MDNILQKIVEGEYEIQPDIAVALDGGTIAFAVSNNTGDKHVIYLDRRIRTDTKDTFYKDAHPGKENSVQLGKNAALVAKIEAALKNEIDKH